VGGSCEDCSADAHDAGGGNSCVDAITMGELPDTGESQVVTGNLYPDGDQDCFSFIAVDTPDTECDDFHVDIRLTSNPDGLFAIEVYRGSCEAPECTTEPYEQYSWATDFRGEVADETRGECPCRPEASDGANLCSDNGAAFHFCVVYAPGAAPACEWYEVEVTNAVYTSS
jgi:hypothetical protein